MSFKTSEQLIQAAKNYADLIPIGPQLFKIVFNSKAKRCICFIAGLHGDEIAGPLGVLEFLKEKPPKNKKIIIIPLANPSGYDLKTRHNKHHKDINRHFLDKKPSGECKQIIDALKEEKIDLLHTIHEDMDMSQFYVYFTHHKELAQDVCALAKKYFGVYKGIGELYGDRVEDGLIALPHVKNGTVEDYFLEKGVPYLVTETPGKAALAKRVQFTKNAMKLVI